VTFFYGFNNENIKKKCRSHVQNILSDIVLARWRRPVAFSKALDLLHWAMRAVLYRHTAAAINMATFLGIFVDCCLFACCSGGCWGDTEQVVARWWRPVASEVARDMPHWGYRLYCSGASARPLKRATMEVLFDVIIDFVIDHNRS
jgi:hypothetical protein